MKKYRLITRSDFDGLVSAVLFKQMGMIDDILFVHPKDMQDGKIKVTENDITTNLPYVKEAFLAFDHHESETIRVDKAENLIIEKDAPSAARVVYEYYKDKLKDQVSQDMLTAVDKADSANFTESEVLHPSGWNMLNFIMDSRTGLGRFRNFRVSNYQLMMELIDHCKDMTIDEILKLPDVQERIDLYNKYELDFKEQLYRCSTLYNNVIVINLKNEKIIYPGNRFVIYTLYPEANISMHVLQGLNNQNTVFAAGKSIFNRTSKVHIGEIMLQYGGGGHSAAGTCQVAHITADKVEKELIESFKDN